MSPDPKPNHQEVAFRLLLALNELLKGSNFVARERTNIEVSGLTSMPSPDVFVIDRKRWNQALRSSNYPQGAPQLVIEIVSPSNRKPASPSESETLSRGRFSGGLGYLS